MPRERDRHSAQNGRRSSYQVYFPVITFHTRTGAEIKATGPVEANRSFVTGTPVKLR